jgi:lipopolysaccharide/colanic/teichoic acid biosynthesis glycosyltransferase
MGEECKGKLLTMKTSTNENNNTLEVQKFDLCDCEKKIGDKSGVISKTQTRFLCIAAVIFLIIFAIISLITAIILVLKLSGMYIICCDTVKPFPLIYFYK